MRVALVHDQLLEFGGAERILTVFKEIFPQADVFTSFYDPLAIEWNKKIFSKWKIKTSWADKIPFIKNIQKPFKFIYPYIWESFNFDNYDLVISSSATYMAKSIITNAKTLHIAYVYHPPRYLYGLDTSINYKSNWLLNVTAVLISHLMRKYDYISSQRADEYLAISHFTRKNIKKYYKRESTTIYPPVVKKYNLIRKYQFHDLNYFLSISRLDTNKHLELLISAANQYNYKLVIIGSGPKYKYLKSIAGKSVEFLGPLENISEEKIKSVLNQTKAYLSAAVDEDFGLSMVEAMSYGIPVIAYDTGGVNEVVKNGINGYLFHEQTATSLADSIMKINSLSFNDYKKLALGAVQTYNRFTKEKFEKNIRNFINNLIANRKRL